jgi:hypothetical protein
MDLRKIGSVVIDWINLAEDGNQWWTLVNLQAPQNVGKILNN